MEWGRKEAGAAGAIGALLTAAATLFLPWLAIPTMSGTTLAVSWLDLVRTGGGGTLYERELFWLPLAASALAFACGAVLLVSPRWRVSRLGSACMAGIAVGGFGLVLCGTRWLGFFVARLLDDGPTLARPHVAPWAVLTLGILLVGGSLAALQPPGLSRRTGPGRWTAAVAAAGLAGLPLLPLASVAGTHLDELTVAAVAARTRSGWPAAFALSAFRSALALLLGFTFLGGWLGPSRPILRRALRPATAAAGFLATAAAALFYWKANLLQEGTNPWPNPVLALVGPTLLALALWPAAWRAASGASPASAARRSPRLSQER